MKHCLILFIVGFQFFCYKSFAKTDTTNVYYQALKLHLEYWNNFHSERPDLVKIPTTYFVESDYYSTEGLPDTIAGHQIQYLTHNEIRIKTKGGKSFPLIAVRPVRWDSRRNLLIIAVIDFTVSRTRRTTNYANGGGSSFEVVCNQNSKVSLRIINQGGI
ncbi:hypothetical protein FUAX_44990 (plasmid) [Fulvitalea axinellae]|uniref:Uncharacterized protein n=2 Tax=Fulvitalea axinellae TaxID=1182444 RepID=A0AAU9D3B6_9BACT|nr:hypothetical protein FUAX_44990 [Fulvitalea axinellae]